MQRAQPFLGPGRGSTGLGFGIGVGRGFRNLRQGNLVLADGEVVQVVPQVRVVRGKEGLRPFLFCCTQDIAFDPVEQLRLIYRDAKMGIEPLGIEVVPVCRPFHPATAMLGRDLIEMLHEQPPGALPSCLLADVEVLELQRSCEPYRRPQEGIGCETG